MRSQINCVIKGKEGNCMYYNVAGDVKRISKCISLPVLVVIITYF